MTTPLPYPQYIALCGNPTCGKSTTAQALENLFGYKLVDDGAFLRQIAMTHFGATWEDVHTQEGKLRTTIVNGETMTWRDVLGRIGNGFENQFGANVIPELAYNGLDPDGMYVFGSVRREQGAYHRKRGALIIEIVNPDAGPSPYEFDRYNSEYAHAKLYNDALYRGLTDEEALADLAGRVQVIVERARAGAYRLD